MDHLRCVVQRITYASEQNGYTVLKCSAKGYQDLITIVGTMPETHVSTSHATKIFKTYGSESIDVVKENPYRLADDIWGIGFKTADTIAMKLGIEKDRYIRLRSGILYTLNKLSESGHCYAVREQLITTAAKLLEVDTPELEATFDEMLRTKEVIKKDDAIYLQPFFFAEAGCARLLKKLMASERRQAHDRGHQFRF